MKTLHLVLKSKWYDMIASGIKTEEYREIKPYWIKRLCTCLFIGTQRCYHCQANRYVECLRNFNEVCFSRGYSDVTMTYQVKGIFIGDGKPEWGAPNENVFIIKLGRRIE